jgi:peptide-methionine (S)-S-oxide reductase
MNRLFLSTSLLAAVAATGILLTPARSEATQGIPAPAQNMPETGNPAVAEFAGGCFWGMTGVFEHVAGVKNVTAGYAGGTADTATYDQVTTETTNHAEAVRIVYDPAKVSYGKLLQIYFSVAHDPTQLDGQYPDSGRSYRSAIFPQSPAQQQAALAYIEQLTSAKTFKRPIVTRIEHGSFYPAEEYHQHYLTRNPHSPYIVAYDIPKVRALQAQYPEVYR